MDDIIKEITQKDDTKALAATQKMLDERNINLFNTLCQNSSFLFDFIKVNVQCRLKKSVNKNNYKNIIDFFSIYNNDFSTPLIEALSDFANEDITDEIYNLLEIGTVTQKINAAKYFSYIPDTIALDLLNDYAFQTDPVLATNSAEALGVMQDKHSLSKAYNLIANYDDFDVMSGVKFLVAYGEKAALYDLLNLLKTTSIPENIAGEIPYLVPLSEIFQTQDINLALLCFDFIILGLGEILPLSNIFDYQIFEITQFLIDKNKLDNNSHIAKVLLRLYEKFNTFSDNEEYIFDESKNIKNEIAEISNLLNSQTIIFWEIQRKLILNELNKNKSRILSALEVILSLNMEEAQGKVLELISDEKDEQVLTQAAGLAKSLKIIDKVDKNKMLNKISDEILKAIAENNFV